VSVEISFFISDFIHLGPPFLLLVNLAKGLSNLFTFTKNQLFVSLIECIFLFISNSLIPALIFIISFLLLLWDWLVCVNLMMGI
jgi:hypothetical protein